MRPTATAGALLLAALTALPAAGLLGSYGTYAAGPGSYVHASQNGLFECPAALLTLSESPNGYALTLRVSALGALPPMALPEPAPTDAEPGPPAVPEPPAAPEPPAPALPDPAELLVAPALPEVPEPTLPEVALPVLVLPELLLPGPPAAPAPPALPEVTVPEVVAPDVQLPEPPAAPAPPALPEVTVPEVVAPDVQLPEPPAAPELPSVPEPLIEDPVTGFDFPERPRSADTQAVCFAGTTVSFGAVDFQGNPETGYTASRTTDHGAQGGMSVEWLTVEPLGQESGSRVVYHGARIGGPTPAEWHAEGLLDASVHGPFEV